MLASSDPKDWAPRHKVWSDKSADTGSDPT
jgi:hypothetical protein